MNIDIKSKNESTNRIKEYIKKCEYNYSIEDVIEGYEKRNKAGM